jgi:hypothetical protein
MHWTEEMAWVGTGALPGAAVPSLAAQSLRKGRLPDERDVTLSVWASIAGGALIAKYGTPAMVEGAQYVGLSSVINLNRSADLGKTVLRSWVRAIPFALYGLIVYKGSTYVAERAAPKMERQLGRDNVERGFKLSGLGSAV